MKRFAIVVLLAPLLLAPVRFQQGGEELYLTPSQAPGGPRGGMAVALPSPTVIRVSPTRAGLPMALGEAAPSPSTSAVPGAVAAQGEVSPVAPPVAPPAAAPALGQGGMTATQAAMCVRALSMVEDLGSLSMKQSGRQNMLDLTIASTLAQVQAAQGLWPSLRLLQQAGVPWFAPYRAEIKQGLDYVTSFCQNPLAPVRASARMAVPR